MKYVSTRCRIYSDLQKFNIPEIDFQGIKVLVFYATFNNICYIVAEFYWWRKLEYPEKTTDLLQDNENFIK